MNRHGVAAISGATLTAVLPRGSGAVLVSLNDGSTTSLSANARGAIARTFKTTIRSITYAGPEGEKVSLPTRAKGRG
jgi:hypothetical protein